MSTMADTGSVFKFLDSTLHVIHVKPSPTVHLAHANALEIVNARYDMTRVALKTITFGAGSISLSIANKVLGILPKRLLFTMLQNMDFTASSDTNPYLFSHFGLNYFVIYVNGRLVPSEELSLNSAVSKTCTMTYQSLFSGLGIHHGTRTSRSRPLRS